VKSKYCQKSSVLNEFANLIEKSKFKNIIVSYSNEGLMSVEDIERVLKTFGNTNSFKIYEIDYRRYANKKVNSQKKLKELLFFIKKV